MRPLPLGLGRRGGSWGGIVILILFVVLALLRGCDSGGGRDNSRGGGDRFDPPGESASALVTRVVDGDTVIVLIDGHEDEVRYIGIDTPESVKPETPVQCFGEQASEFNEELVEGEQVLLVFDAERRDQYGRLLAYVYLGDQLVNAELMRRGLARTLTIPPNDSKAALFKGLANQAAEQGIGLWGAC